MNRLKTLLLLTALTVLFIFVGQIIGGRQGMIIAFGFAIVMNFFSYWFSDKMVLGMYRAQKVTEAEAPQLVQQVRIQAQQAGLPMPRVYIVPNSSPNAFATGRNPEHAAVAFTQGILDLLEPDELDGVIAHELGHVKNRDILTQSIAATVAGAISMLANMVYWGAMFGGYGGGGRSRNSGGSLVGLLIMAIVAPIAAMFIQMAISRSREFAADATGARTSGRPLSLANALRKLHSGVHRQPMNASTATAHMFIVNPLTRQSFASLFATHPPIEERIARLEKLAYSR